MARSNWLSRATKWFRRRESRIGDERRLFGRPPALPGKPPDFADAVEFPLLDRWSTHPGQGLTPRRVVEIFKEAENGYPFRQCDLFEDIIETDGHLRSQFERRVDAVAGKESIWQQRGERPSDILAARKLEDRVMRLPNFDEAVKHQLRAIGYGYSLTAITWEEVDGLISPVHLENVPHRRFIFDELDQPRILSDGNWLEGEALAPGSWIGSRASGRIAAKSGVMRTATWWSLWKRLAVKDWIVLCERFGIPYVIGRYDAAQASELAKQTLMSAVRALGSDGQATFTKDMEIEVIKVENTGKATDVHGAICALCDREIAKLFSGATLLSDSGGPGSYALGAIHENRSFDLTLSDEKRVGERFMHDLGAAFVAFNGLPGRAPRLRHHVTREVDPKTRMELYSRAANELGAIFDAEQIYQEFQFKRPKGAPDILKGTAKPKPAPADEAPAEEPAAA